MLEKFRVPSSRGGGDALLTDLRCRFATQVLIRVQRLRAASGKGCHRWQSAGEEEAEQVDAVGEVHNAVAVRVERGKASGHGLPAELPGECTNGVGQIDSVAATESWIRHHQRRCQNLVDRARRDPMRHVRGVGDELPLSLTETVHALRQEVVVGLEQVAVEAARVEEVQYLDLSPPWASPALRGAPAGAELGPGPAPRPPEADRSALLAGAQDEPGWRRLG